MSERLKQNETPREYAERLSGTPIFDRIDAPKGWVVDSGLLSDEVWENIRTFALPISPRGFNPIARLKARRMLQRTKERFGGKEIVLMAIPDTEARGNWSVRPVIVEDLKKEAVQALNEGFQALRDEDLVLADSKRHAYMAISGATDSK